MTYDLVMAKRSRFYVYMALAMVVVTFWGFSETYFAPLFTRESAFGRVGGLPLVVHIHGLSFFLWYLFLVWQAALIAGSNRRLHRRTGMATVALVAVMVVSGLIIIPINVYNESQMPGPPIWTLFGPVILATLFMFVTYYVLAIRNRTTPEKHKRYMILAGIPALGAAVFRIFLSLLGEKLSNIPAGILVTNLFIVAAMIHDRRTHGRVHGIYWIGLAACLGTELLMLALPHTPAGPPIHELLAAIGGQLLWLYD
jgi:hypothetical protein